jgi:hypothetical protein
VDRAAKIRQELKDSGYEAEMVAGELDGKGHCWIKYRKQGESEWKNIWNY